MVLRGFIILFIFWTSLGSIAQDYGKPFVINYPPNTFPSSQNWSVTGDEKGNIFVGNLSSVSRFNGHKWEIIEVKSSKDVIAGLAFQSTTHRLFYGSFEQIGYLTRTPSATWENIVLNDSFPNLIEGTGIIWQCHSLDNKVWFRSDSAFFEYDGESLNKWHLPKGFSKSFLIENEMYVVRRTGELLKRTPYGLEPALTNLVKNKRILSMHQNADKTLSISYLSDQDNLCVACENPESPACNVSSHCFTDPMLTKKFVYSSLPFINGVGAFATLEGGLVLMDSKGNSAFVLDDENGLQDNMIYHLYQDREDGVWAGMGAGVARIELNGPFSYWDKSMGFKGTINHIIRHQGVLYISSNNGVYKMVDNLFHQVLGVNGQCWKFNSVGPRLMVGTHLGPAEVLEDEVRLIAETGNSYTVCLSAINSDYLWDGKNGGLFLHSLKSGNIHEFGKIKDEVRSIIEDSIGDIWVATYNVGVYKIENPYSSEFLIHHLDSSSGITSNEKNELLKVKNKLILYNDDIREWNSKLQRFEYLQMEACEKSNLNSRIFPVSINNSGNFCFYSTSNERSNFGGYGTNLFDSPAYSDTIAFKRIKKEVVQAMYIEEDGVIWSAAANVLYRFDPKLKSKGISTFPCNIDLVKFGDSTTYISSGIPNNIAYNLNSAAFYFSSLSTLGNDDTEYRYFLEGYDKDWSKWNNERYKEFTNLWEGKYIFHLQARNTYGTESEFTQCEFYIKPPFYRAWWAFLFYIVLIYSLIKFYIYFITNKKEKEKKELEKIVKDRTKKVEDQKKQLEKKNKIIENKTEDLYRSLSYAMTLQGAILPENEFFEKHFQEFFIIFLPKDMVSGDFYWVSESANGDVYWACIDCTGHGIPGGFMSMMGYSVLNRIMLENDEIPVNEILNSLRTEVIRNMNLHTQKPLLEGMDISLCKLNKERNMIEFAGAFQTMFVESEGQLTTYHGDRMPIGMTKKLDHIPFTVQQIPVKKGDRVYMFTDGYTDQIGGGEDETIKRFNKWRLKDVLKTIDQKNMVEQKIILLDTFNEWQSTFPIQLDDVSFIGVRI